MTDREVETLIISVLRFENKPLTYEQIRRKLPKVLFIARILDSLVKQGRVQVKVPSRAWSSLHYYYKLIK